MTSQSKITGLMLALLLQACLLAISPLARANTPITVDYNTVVRALDPNFNGVNYEAYWDPIQGSIGSREALRRAGVKLIRFPGGTPASFYDWANPYLDGWSSTSPLQLWQYAQGVGAKVLFETDATTNHSNDPSGAHAAAFVTYARNNGIDAPLWEVDNEPDNYMTTADDYPYLQWYFNAFNQQAPAMKAANPNIKVMGPAATNVWFWWGLDSLNMFKAQCDANADAISLHVYDGPDYPGYDNIKGVAQIWQNRMDFIRSVYPTKPIYITEWNATGQPGAASQTSGLMVADADVIGAFAKSGVTAHCFFGSIHAVNNNWGILYGSGDIRAADTPAPAYFILPLWSKMGDRVLNVTNPADASSVLSVWSHKKVDGSVQVMLINKTAAQSVDVSFSGFDPTGKTVNIYECKASAGGNWDFDVIYNNVLTPNVATTDLPAPLTQTVSGSTYTRNLPAYSVTVLDFPGNGNPTSPPSAPTGVTATPNNSQVSLSWTGSTGNAASYSVKRSTTHGGPYTTIASPLTTNDVDTGLTNGTTYYYVVSATNSAGTSGNSAEVSAAPALQAPTALTATAAIAQVALSWTGSLGATSYKVKRSTTSGGPYVTVGSPTGSNASDTGLINGTTYFYVVSAVNTSGESANSSEASGIPAPSLAINCGGGAANPFISDTDVSGGNSTSNWQGAVDTSAVTNPAPLAVYQTERWGDCTYTVPGPVSGASYTVRLHFTEDYNTGSGQRIFNVSINGVAVLTNFDIFAATGAMHKATIQQFTTTATSTGITIALTGVSGNAKIDGIEVLPAGGPPPPTIPAPPAGLTATAGNAQVALSWTASTGATSYNVKRSLVTGGPYTALFSPIATNYTNVGLTNGTAYYYVVTATNSIGTSANSSQASAMPVSGVTIPAPPAGLTATGGNAQVVLSWSASTGATSYNVKRATATGGPYTTVSSPTATSFTNTGLTNGAAYFYVVTAVNTAGESGNSNQASATPASGVSIPPAPALQTATPGNALVTLTFTTVPGATSYNLKSATTAGGPYVTDVTGVAGTGATITAIDPNQQNGVLYWFVVSAVNSAGESINSNALTATPSAPSNGSLVVAINCGGGAAGAFIADNYMNGGSPNSVTSTVDTTGVTNPAPQSVYQSERFGAFSYTIPGLTAGTSYTVRLHFAEIFDNLAGKRLINVGINSTQVLTSFDIFTAAGGFDKAIVREFPATANGSGQIIISVAAAPSSPDQLAKISGIEIVTGGPPPTIPAPPGGLTATAGNAQVALSWTASSGATSYNVKRGTATGGPYSTVGPNITTVSYTNTGLTNGATYFYVVTAVNTNGESGNSNEASAMPISGGAVPAAPKGVAARAGNAQVTVTWVASTGATSYGVLRSTASGGPYVAVSSGVTAKTYSDSGLTNGTAYYYVVTASNASGTSPNSGKVSATPIVPIAVNAGGPAVGAFLADTGFVGGASGANWSGIVNTSGVSNPAPQAVYQTERNGNFTYTIGGLPANSSRRVRLHFTEDTYTGSNQRRFNVAVNGHGVLTNFDLYGTAGAQHKAVIREFITTASSAGQVVIQFTGVVQAAKVDGIEVQ